MTTTNITWTPPESFLLRMQKAKVECEQLLNTSVSATLEHVFNFFLKEFQICMSEMHNVRIVTMDSAVDVIKVEQAEERSTTATVPTSTTIPATRSQTRNTINNVVSKGSQLSKNSSSKHKKVKQPASTSPAPPPHQVKVEVHSDEEEAQLPPVVTTTAMKRRLNQDTQTINPNEITTDPVPKPIPIATYSRLTSSRPIVTYNRSITANSIIIPAVPDSVRKPSPKTDHPAEQVPLHLKHDFYKTISLKCLKADCFQRYKQILSMDMHMVRDHTPPVLPWRCYVADCGQSFKDDEALAVHQKTDHDFCSTQWPCSECKYVSPNIEELSNHVINFHQEGLFACVGAGCNFEAPYRSILYAHTKANHPLFQFLIEDPNVLSRRFICKAPFCFKDFTCNYNRSIHHWNHWDYKPFRCNFKDCNFRATQRGHVLAHIRDRTRGHDVEDGAEYVTFSEPSV